MIIFAMLILLSFILYQPSPRAAYHVMMLIASAGLYALPLPVGKIRAVARWLAVPVLGLIILCPWDNLNVMAMWVWAIFFLAATPEITLPNGILLYMALWAMATTNSEGGWLALGAGLATMAWGWPGFAGAFAAEVIVTVAKSWNPLADIITAIFPVIGGGQHIPQFATGGVHWDMLRYALTGCLRQPWGNGLGQYEFWAGTWGAWHAHNLIADVGYSLGIGGLILLAIISLTCWRANKPIMATGWMAAFAIHSLVDGPIWYIWPLLIIALKEVEFGNYYNDLWRTIGINLCRYRPGPADTVAPSVGVDARPADTAGPVRGD